MLKRILVLSFLVPVLGLSTPGAASSAGRLFTGHVRGFSATSLSVADREVITVTIDEHTTFSKLITQKPWQGDTRLDRKALRVGQYVAVHLRADGTVADWVEIATDRPIEPAVVER